MSMLKVNQIKTRLRSMFEQHLDLADISPTDSERDQKILSRCLAAFAVYQIAGCTEMEAASSVWDGADDNGIDAAFYDVTSSSVVFVQSKFIAKGSGEPEAKEIGIFIKGVKDAIEQDQSDFHPRLQGKISDIFLRIGTPGTLVNLVVVSTGESTLAKHATSLIEKFLEELNGNDPEPIASYDVLGLSAVYSGLANDLASGSVALDSNILEWSYVASPYPAYFGVIDGLTLKGWWKKHGKGLVSSNIRHSLGATDVNNQIKQTAQQNPEKFWYFNNGITLVCEEAIKAPAGGASRSAGVFAFKGASIVNGAQTVSSLGGVSDDAALGNVRVPIRVVLLKSAPQEFGREVTRANNLQNRIEQRDFVAQDQEQHRLRQEMALEGIDYQFVRSEESVATATYCELIEVITALACASGDPSLAVHVKTGIGRFFADLSKPPYKSLFNPTTSGAKTFNAVLIQRSIDGWIESKKRTISKKSGPEWGSLIHGNRILSAAVFKKYDVSRLSTPIDTFKSQLSPGEIETLCNEAYGKMVAELNSSFSGKFLAVLFKNPSMSKQVFDYATS